MYLVKKFWRMYALTAHCRRRNIKKGFRPIFPIRDFAVIGEAFRHVLAGEPSIYEARMKAGGSEYVWCRVHVTPVVENGIPVRMIGVLININDMKESSAKQASQTDMLTGLRNKSSAEARIRRILRSQALL